MTLAFLGAGRSGPPIASAGLTRTWRAHNATEFAASSFTIEDVDIGAPSADRVVVFGAFVGTASGLVASVTIGGVAATPRVNPTAATTRLLFIFSAVVPTGTTADIVVTLTAVGARIGYDVWTVEGTTQAAPHDVSASTPTGVPSDVTISTPAGFEIPAGGAAFAVTFHNNSNVTGGETVWTQSAGVGTQRSDGRAGVGQWFSAYDTLQSGTITITATNAQAATLIQIAAISWGP